VGAVAEAIAEMIADQGTRAALAAGAITHARALSWERCAAATYGLAQTGEIEPGIGDLVASAAQRHLRTPLPHLTPP
jgi:hypothetical protein